MKLLEVDAWVNSELQKRVKEVHPELSFYELNDRRPMSYGKKMHEGLDERRRLVRDAGFGGVISGMGEYSRSHVGEDDVLDACVACWSAARILSGNAVCIPVEPPYDSRRLRMEILR
jgi:predicted RNase H-like nuclease